MIKGRNRQRTGDVNTLENSEVPSAASVAVAVRYGFGIALTFKLHAAPPAVVLPRNVHPSPSVSGLAKTSTVQPGHATPEMVMGGPSTTLLTVGAPIPLLAPPFKSMPSVPWSWMLFWVITFPEVVPPSTQTP
jgi:hypothetical protein